MNMRMARIKGRKREETREACLAAALKTFTALGFEGASLQKIATRAGVTAATLCHHFDSKQGLYDAVVDEIYRDLVGLTDAVPQDMPMEAQIEAVYIYLRERRDAMRLLLRNIIASSGVSRRVREVHMAPLLMAISPVVAKRFEAPLPNARRTMVALTHLMMRFATNSDEDNRLSFAAATPEEAHEQIVATLVGVARYLLYDAEV